VISSDSRILLENTYDNIIVASQNAVWSFIRNACETGYNVQDKGKTRLITTKNILMKKPEILSREVTSPYIIVPLPKISETFQTFGLKSIYVTFDIEIWFKEMDSARLVDFIRKTLHNQETLFSSQLALYRFLNTGSGLDDRDLPGGDTAFCYTLTVMYEWLGAY
jgi:hypothetical protein